MTTINLEVITTNVGLQAVLDAQNQGLTLRLTHIGLGDGAYTPTKQRTTLANRRVLLEIASSQVNASNYQLDLSAAAQGPEEFWVREVGIYDELGRLIFVWSHPSQSLGYKSEPSRFLIGLSLIVTEVPLGGITIVDQGQPLNLAIGDIEADLSGEHPDGGAHHFPLTNWIERDWLDQASIWEYHAEILRGMGQSGIYMCRGYARAGTESFNRSFDGSYAALALHDHPNYPGTPGMGEISAVLNGYYLRTRHNDYRLNAPSASAYLATTPVQPPAVPPSVAAALTVDAQIAEMRAYFQAFNARDTSIRDYRQHFRWTMSVLELWPELLDGDDLGETFNSFRHQEDSASLRDQLLKTLRFNNSGHKGRFENVSFIPASLRQVSATGKPQWVIWRFRIVSVDVGSVGDYPIDQLITHVDQPGERWHFDRTPDQMLASRNARFRLNVALSSDPAFGANSSFGLLDTLMGKVPGFDGPGSNLVENYLESGALTKTTEWGTTTPLNAAYYNRRYSFQPDASNRVNLMRGFNDPHLFVASTTRNKVAQFEDGGQTYRFTYAIPLELILRTPLESWDPYVIPAVAAITGNGQTAATAYNGRNDNAYHYHIPADFFTADAPAPDPADTGGGTKYVKDAGGVARLVRGAGIRTFLPAIDGIGSLRIRYPIYPLFWEGGHAQAMVQALAGDVARLSVPTATAQQQQADVIANLEDRVRILESRLQHHLT